VVDTREIAGFTYKWIVKEIKNTAIAKVGGSPGPRPLPSPPNTWHGRLLDVSLLIYTSISTGTGVVSGRSLPRAPIWKYSKTGKVYQPLLLSSVKVCKQELNKLFSEDRLWQIIQMTLTNFYHLRVRDPKKKKVPFRNVALDVGFGHILRKYRFEYSNTHTHIYIYLYIYVCMYVCTYVCMYV